MWTLPKVISHTTSGVNNMMNEDLGNKKFNAAQSKVTELNDKLRKQLTKEQFSLVRDLVEAEIEAESYCNR